MRPVWRKIAFNVPFGIGFGWTATCVHLPFGFSSLTWLPALAVFRYPNLWRALINCFAFTLVGSFVMQKKY